MPLSTLIVVAMATTYLPYNHSHTCYATIIPVMPQYHLIENSHAIEPTTV